MKQIIIVGSGPSGLSAAYHLRAQGHSVRVLESKDVIGGRVQTLERDGCLLDTGASLIPGNYKEFLEMCEALDISDKVTPSGSVVGFSKGGKLHYMDSSRMFIDGALSQLFGLVSKARFLRIGLDAARIFPTLRFDTIEGAGKFDTETADSYSERALNEEVGEHFVTNTIRSMFGNTSADASVIDFFWGVKNFLGGRMLGLLGGNGVFIEALARDVDIATNIYVKNIEEVDGRVYVETVDADGKTERLEADGCICATDANTAGEITSGLPASVEDYLKTYPYCASLSVHFVVSKRSDEKAFVLELPISEEPDMTPLVYEHNKVADRAPADKGLLCALYGHYYSKEHFDDDDETIIQNTIDSMRKYVPDIDDILISSHLTRWERSVVKSEPGLYRNIGPLMKFRRENEGRVQLAGDYFSISGMNTAVVSGRIAAERMMKNI